MEPGGQSRSVGADYAGVDCGAMGEGGGEGGATCGRCHGVALNV